MGIASLFLFLQGGLVFVAGVYGLICPAELVAQMGYSTLGVPDQIAQTMGLQLLTMGVYFILVSAHPSAHRTALLANVPLRLLAAYTFYAAGKGSIAAWEVVWAGLNGLAFACDQAGVL